jgi:hypothetical protein
MGGSPGRPACLRRLGPPARAPAGGRAGLLPFRGRWEPWAGPIRAPAPVRPTWTRGTGRAAPGPSPRSGASTLGEERLRGLLISGCRAPPALYPPYGVMVVFWASASFAPSGALARTVSGPSASSPAGIAWCVMNSHTWAALVFLSSDPHLRPSPDAGATASSRVPVLQPTLSAQEERKMPPDLAASERCQ